MDIYYCTNCKGNPYTKILYGSTECPVCGKTLTYGDVSEESLSGRPLLYSSQITLKNRILNLFSGDNKEENKENIFKETLGRYNIEYEEQYFLYLSIMMEKKDLFKCRFVIGNAPDKLNVISKTPFFSSDICFSDRLEISYLEECRVLFENQIQNNGIILDPSLFHIYYAEKSEIKEKKKIDLNFRPDGNRKENESDRYFLMYSANGYGDIDINSKKEDNTGFINELVKVHNMHNKNYIDYVFFREKKTGISYPLATFADNGAVLYDDPYSNLVRYDRIMKEMTASIF